MSEQEEDFAALFEASTKAQSFKRGQAVDGRIVAIGAKVALIDIGGKGEAEMDVAELKDADGDIEVAVGDRITAMVVSTSGGITLSRKGVRNAATHREIEDAYRNGLAVEGRVVQEVKGGYEVRIARERAFCPLSQIDIVRTKTPAVHVGQTYPFRVIEYKNGGKDIVVSRRNLLEQQQADAEEVRRSIVPGAVMSGRVVSVRDFGAFVDLGGGIQGLLHVSEMSWSHTTNPGEIVAVGDQLTVKVLRVDAESGKIALGLKQLQDDPWAAVTTSLHPEQVVTARVTRVAEFGIFVELAPGIEGLLPLAESGLDRGADVRRAFPAGTILDVVILDIDAAAHRIRVSKRAVAIQQEQAEVREYTSRQQPAASPSIGSLADKLRGALGGERKDRARE